MISSKTQLFGVIGDPIEHSLSPFLQNWLIDRYHIDGRYTAFHVLPVDLADAIRGMRALGIHGLNVTVPHKEKVLAYLDNPSPEVRLVGSANTILNDNGFLQGFNTDVPGFINSVDQQFNFFKNARVLIIGAGGAARALAFALKSLLVSELILSDLSMKVTEPLLNKCRKEFGMSNVRGLSINDPEFAEIVPSCDVIINATPVGMAPHTDRSPLPAGIQLHQEMMVYDLIYNPAKTRLLSDAEKAGARIKNGVDMLIFQGVESMKIWTNKDIRLNNKALSELRSLLNNALSRYE